MSQEKNGKARTIRSKTFSFFKSNESNKSGSLIGSTDKLDSLEGEEGKSSKSKQRKNTSGDVLFDPSDDTFLPEGAVICADFQGRTAATFTSFMDFESSPPSSPLLCTVEPERIPPPSPSSSVSTSFLSTFSVNSFDSTNKNQTPLPPFTPPSRLTPPSFPPPTTPPPAPPVSSAIPGAPEFPDWLLRQAGVSPLGSRANEIIKP